MNHTKHRAQRRPRRPWKSEQASWRNAAIRIARQKQLFLLFDREGQEDEKWMFYCQISGQAVVTFLPRSGFWSCGREHGRLAPDDWRTIFTIVQRIRSHKEA